MGHVGRFAVLSTASGYISIWVRKTRIHMFSGGDDTMNTPTPEAEALLTPAEVAAMFRVDPKTVTRWAKAGKLSSIRTLGGHRRYRESEVKELLSGTLPQQRNGDNA
jgi:excisionase family DNA binding protein